MTDIVERLRNVAVLEWCEPMCVEAADEIERLKIDRDVWRNESIKKQAACEQMGARITALEAERDKERNISDRTLALCERTLAERVRMKEAMLGLARIIERHHSAETDEEFREIDAALTAARNALKEISHD